MSDKICEELLLMTKDILKLIQTVQATRYSDGSGEASPALKIQLRNWNKTLDMLLQTIIKLQELQNKKEGE